MSETELIDEPMGAMQAFLHPRRARALMQAQAESLERAQAQADADAEARRALENQVAELKRERSSLQASNTEISLRLKRLGEEHEALQGEVAEIEAMFKRVEAMKRKYDERIARYKTKVSDLEAALKREEEAALADITPIPPAVRPRSADSPRPAPKADPAGTEGEWYLPLDL